MSDPTVHPTPAQSPAPESGQPIPLYYQIRQKLEQRILEGEFPVESQLPPEHEICKVYSVSRITCRKALEQMEQDGVIYRVRGRGSFVKRLPAIQSGAPHISRMVELRCMTPRAMQRFWSSPWFTRAFEREFPGVRLVAHNAEALSPAEAGSDRRYNGMDLYTVPPAEVQGLRRRGLLERWSDVTGEKVWRELRASVPPDLLRSVGEEHGDFLVPLVYTPVAFIYNRTIFQKAGIPEPRFNWSQSEFFNACEALQSAQADARREGRRFFPFFCNFPNGNRWPLALYQEGGRIWSEDGLSCALDRESSLRGIRYYRELIADRGWAWPYHGEGAEADHMLFARGYVGIQLGTMITVNRLMQENCMDWGVLAVPEGQRRTTIASKCLLAASPHLRDRGLASEFLQFIRRPDVLAQQFAQWEIFNTSTSAMEEIRSNLPEAKRRYVDAFLRLVPEIAPIEYPALLAAESRLEQLIPLLWIDIEHAETHCREIAREINEMPELKRLREFPDV